MFHKPREKRSLKRCVFRFFLKEERDGELRTFVGREFQILAACWRSLKTVAPQNMVPLVVSVYGSTCWRRVLKEPQNIITPCGGASDFFPNCWRSLHTLPSPPVGRTCFETTPSKTRSTYWRRGCCFKTWFYLIKDVGGRCLKTWSYLLQGVVLKHDPTC